jgi:preprotein translocase subunit YajC
MQTPLCSMGKVPMRLFVAFASASLVLATPLYAQAAAGFTVGAQVLDSSGNPVGTVTAVSGDVVTVKTDKLEANLGKSSFAQQDGKLYVGMSQAELNAAVEKDKAAAEASLAVGATVKDSAGASVGKIEAIDAEFVTLKLASGKSVRIPRAGIAGSANGAIIGVTVADLEKSAS